MRFEDAAAYHRMTPKDAWVLAALMSASTCITILTMFGAVTALQRFGVIETFYCWCAK